MVQSAEKNHTAFKIIRQETIPSLNITVSIFEHIKTRAQHIHLAAENSENVFMVAFRTMPKDSTGVAHILEHTALCGSKHYPVRDPFFSMIKRSINTFMNAFTASDWTAYPFASKNKKDYFNLLSVYLDAAFFSRLDPLDFAQEGHRMELSDPNDLNSDLVFKGVVFNEMKGAMSSPAYQVEYALSKYLNPTNTYHNNSGGEPSHIPDLSYNDLVDFYKSHYHPSNATFATYGDIPVEEIHAELEEKVLQHFDFLDEHISVSPEKRYFAPIQVTEHYPLDPHTPLEHQTHHVLGWLWDAADDLEHRLEAQLLANILLFNSSSPLSKALEQFPGAKTTSSVSGVDTDKLEIRFRCGVSGSDPDQIEAFEKCVFDTLNEVAENGVDPEQIESILHQLELNQREVNGGSFPYGLYLILTCLSGMIHRGDPIGLLDIDPAIAKLRKECEDKDFIPRLIRTHLIDNPHRVRLTLIPDHEMAARRDQAETKRLAQAKDKMSREELLTLKHQAEALKARQEEKDDNSILPKVEISDLPKDVSYAKPESSIIQVSKSNWPLTSFALGANGVVYQGFTIDLPELSLDELHLLPIYMLCLGELGTGKRSYLEMQAWQAKVSGGLDIEASFDCKIDDLNEVTGQLFIYSKGLRRNHQALSELLQATLEEVRFNELDRLVELVEYKRSQMEHMVTRNGHELVGKSAGADLSIANKLDHITTGLDALRNIKKLASSLKDAEAREALGHQLEQLHKRILTAPRRLVLITDPDNIKTCEKEIIQQWQNSSNVGSFTPFSIPFEKAPQDHVWLTNTQVNFCSTAYRAVPRSHPDSAALSILARYLKNSILHRTVREQGGAYGVGALFNKDTGIFFFFSYRDPRFIETLHAFEDSVRWILEDPQDPEYLKQAILGQVALIDRPHPPQEEARIAYEFALRNYGEEGRKAFRNQLINTKLEDLQRVAEKYLIAENQVSNRCTSVMSQNATWESLRDKIDMTPIKL